MAPPPTTALPGHRRGTPAHASKPSPMVAMGIAGRLALARELRGLSARALSTAAGLSPSLCTQIESGRNVDPGVRVVERLAVAAGVRPEWLAFGTGTVLATPAARGGA